MSPCDVLGMTVSPFVCVAQPIMAASLKTAGVSPPTHPFVGWPVRVTPTNFPASAMFTGWCFAVASLPTKLAKASAAVEDSNSLTR